MRAADQGGGGTLIGSTPPHPRGGGIAGGGERPVAHRRPQRKREGRGGGWGGWGWVLAAAADGGIRMGGANQRHPEYTAPHIYGTG